MSHGAPLKASRNLSIPLKNGYRCQKLNTRRDHRNSWARLKCMTYLMKMGGKDGMIFRLMKKRTIKHTFILDALSKNMSFGWICLIHNIKA